MLRMTLKYPAKLKPLWLALRVHGLYAHPGERETRLDGKPGEQRWEIHKRIPRMRYTASERDWQYKRIGHAMRRDESWLIWPERCGEIDPLLGAFLEANPGFENGC